MFVIDGIKTQCVGGGVGNGGEKRQTGENTERLGLS